jgi:predicted RNase H-like nuclease
MAFPEAANPRRAAEVAARVALGRRRSSLFFTPPRVAFEAATHAEACVLSRAAGAGGVSQQAYRLGPKVLEVARWRDDASCPVYEVHPELAFTVMLGQPAVHSKKTPEGHAERRAALAANGLTIDNLRRGSPDDLLDAAACAWTARRIVNRCAQMFPPDRADVIWA